MRHDLVDTSSVRVPATPLPELHAEFALATADRRRWRVQVTIAMLTALSGRVMRSAEMVESTINYHMHQLEMAALRAVGCGDTSGDLVRLTARHLRLPG